MTGDAGAQVVAARFPPTPSAGRQVRAFVAEHVEELGLATRGEDLQLAATELATNVVLHAHTEFEVRLVVRPGGARIEVSDGSPTLPTPGTLTATAMSGRGLVLLGTIVDRWGVNPMPGNGKTIWCELALDAKPAEAPVDVGALLALWDVHPPPISGETAELVEVTVPDLPVQELLAAKCHMEDLLREFQLILLQHPNPAATPPSLLPYTQLAARLDSAAVRFAEGRRQMRQQAQTAQAHGQRDVTVHLRLPRDAASAAADYLNAIEDAEHLAQGSTHLLTTVDTMQIHSDVRHRYLQTVVRQVTPHRL